MADPPAQPDAPAALPEVTLDEAVADVERGAVLLDVREPQEWDAGHAARAVHLPLGSLEEHLDELEGADRIVVVCRSGGRSAAATQRLVAAGFPAANLVGGMQGWAAAGLAVVATAGGPGTVV